MGERPICDSCNQRAQPYIRRMEGRYYFADFAFLIIRAVKKIRAID